MLPTTDEIFAALRTCRIPEIPVNLGERGLFHGVGMNAPHSAVPGHRGCASSRPTNCPIAYGIAGTVQRTIEVLAAIRDEIVCGLLWYLGLFSEEGLRRSQPSS